MITSGRGKYKVWLLRHNIGDDLIFFLGGGKRSHIGGAVIAESNKKIKKIRLTGHHDDIVLQLIAEAVRKKYKKTVVVIGGIHIDGATKTEIDLLVENCRKLLKKI